MIKPFPVNESPSPYKRGRLEVCYKAGNTDVPDVRAHAPLEHCDRTPTMERGGREGGGSPVCE